MALFHRLRLPVRRTVTPDAKAVRLLDAGDLGEPADDSGLATNPTARLTLAVGDVKGFDFARG